MYYGNRRQKEKRKMIFEEKRITLKDKRTAVLKSPSPDDAGKMLNCIKQACGETVFLARYPEEWTTTEEQEKEWIESMCSSSGAIPIVCYIDGKIVGNCEIRFFGGMKTSHRASVAIAVLKDYWNLGIGSAMFECLVEEAKAHGSEIMELDFIEGNDRARHLYEKFGFEVICKKPDMYRLKDGTYLGEVYMQKSLKK